MQIAGFEKNSLVDFPKTLASVIFAPGCNMNCWYCHNAGIQNNQELTMDAILEFLKKRVGFIDGVVFSGGEVTLQPDLAEQMQKVKELGFKVKLDTNGTNPDVLINLVNSGLVDYVAMDIKAPLSKYKQITRTDDNIENIKKSIAFLMEDKVDYEFRTTFSPDLFVDDIKEIAKTISGAKRYSIQQYRQMCYNKKLEQKPHEPKYLLLAKDVAEPYVKEVLTKGI